MLDSIVDCRDVTVWGISQEEVDAYKAHLEPLGYNVDTTLDAADVALTEAAVGAGVTTVIFLSALALTAERDQARSAADPGSATINFIAADVSM